MKTRTRQKKTQRAVNRARRAPVKINDPGADYIEHQFDRKAAPATNDTTDCPFDPDVPDDMSPPASEGYNDTIWNFLCFEAEVPPSKFDTFRDVTVAKTWPRCGAFKTTLLKSGKFYIVGYTTEAQLIKWEANQPGPLGAVEDH